MDEEPTCGRGLAEQSVLPAKLGALIASLADNLERHLPTLDLDDPQSRQEHEAYAGLAQTYREIAARLRATADRMAGYRDLPMGRHHDKALADPGIVQAFAKFVAIKRELLDLLGKMLAQEDALLAAMRGRP